ncbi:MAG: hypothetical protein LBJ32_02775 [Oscillospiraceae bacterium]|nr:hypothetical protein [Oscillospiraceae bacterium]
MLRIRVLEVFLKFYDMYFNIILIILKRHLSAAPWRSATSHRKPLFL